MAAPEGNQFWKLRSKHGRGKLFATPDLMMQAAEEYFEWCDKTPIIKREVETSLKDTKSKKIELRRPYQLRGLCVYLKCNERYFNDFERELKKDDPLYDEFSYVITCIRDIITAQKYEGGATGEFNSNVITRDLGLREKQEIESTIKQENIITLGGKEYKV